MTPAIASEPYCAAAPSRSTSMRSMALMGMVFRSAGDEPRPAVPLTLTTAVVCQRLPSTSTSVWSGDRPRSCAGRTAEVPSAMAGRGKFSDGSRRAKAVASSVVPVDCRSLAVSTSMGDSESATLRFTARVPVTMTAPSCAGSACWACANAGAPQAAQAEAVSSANGAVCVSTGDCGKHDGWAKRTSWHAWVQLLWLQTRRL